MPSSSRWSEMSLDKSGRAIFRFLKPWQPDDHPVSATCPETNTEGLYLPRALVNRLSAVATQITRRLIAAAVADALNQNSVKLRKTFGCIDFIEAGMIVKSLFFRGQDDPQREAGHWFREDHRATSAVSIVPGQRITSFMNSASLVRIACPRERLSAELKSGLTQTPTTSKLPFFAD